MTTHDLKVIEPYFSALASQKKTFEVRKEDDRRYEVGDYLVLRKYDAGRYTGHCTGAIVTYLLRGPAFGIEEGHVGMALRFV